AMAAGSGNDPITSTVGPIVDQSAPKGGIVGDGSLGSNSNKSAEGADPAASQTFAQKPAQLVDQSLTSPAPAAVDPSLINGLAMPAGSNRISNAVGDGTLAPSSGQNAVWRPDQDDGWQTTDTNWPIDDAVSGPVGSNNFTNDKHDVAPVTSSRQAGVIENG